MTLKDLVGNWSRDGVAYDLEAGLSGEQIGHCESVLGTPLPVEIRELLQFTSALKMPLVGRLSFNDVGGFGMQDIVPLGASLAKDEFGNQWIVDVNKETGDWGPVVFMSHDPPVFVIQAPSLLTFLHQLSRPLSDNRVAEGAPVPPKFGVEEIWKEDPYLMDADTARRSPNEELAAFAISLSDTFRFADLHEAKPGSGFAWGRYGPDTVVRRKAPDLLFAVGPRKAPFRDRLFGRSSRRA